MGIRARSRIYPSHLALKSPQIVPGDVELPLQVRTHLALHLVDLAEGEHGLADDGPGLVAVRVVTHDFARDHERGEEEAVARGAACGGKAGLEAVEEGECGEGDGGMQARAVECVSDEVGEGERDVRMRGRGACGRLRRRERLGTVERVCDKSGTKFRGLFVAIVRLGTMVLVG